MPFVPPRTLKNYQVLIDISTSIIILQVCEEQRCEDDVFPLSMNYLDRYLSVREIHRTQLQSLGSACMLLASKVR